MQYVNSETGQTWTTGSKGKVPKWVKKQIKNGEAPDFKKVTLDPSSIIDTDTNYPIISDDDVKNVVFNVLDSQYLPRLKKSLSAHKVKKSLNGLLFGDLLARQSDSIYLKKLETFLGDVYPLIICDICNKNTNLLCEVIPTSSTESAGDIKITDKITNNIIKLSEIKASNVSTNSNSRKACIKKLKEFRDQNNTVDVSLCYMNSATMNQKKPDNDNDFVKEFEGKYAWIYLTGFNCYRQIQQSLKKWIIDNQEELDKLCIQFRKKWYVKHTQIN